MYIVMSLQQSISAGTFGGGELALNLNWADGMIGAVPMFERREDAEAYAREGQQIVKVEVAGG